MLRKIISSLILLIIWEITALFVDNNVILPLPFDVLYYMFDLLKESSFYLSVLFTLFRVLLSFGIAMFIGVVLGLAAGLNKKINDYISPLMSLLQTIPQITYILILLVWFSSFYALITITCLMLIPIFFNNIRSGLYNMNSDLKDVLILYDQPFMYQIKKVYLPSVKSHFKAAIKSALPLSFKVGVMAEIFVQTNLGIGSKLYFAKMQIDMTGIFAWTIWLILLLMLVDKLIKIYDEKY